MKLIDRDEALLLFGIIDDGSCDDCPHLRDKSGCGNELFSRNDICETFDCIKDVDAEPVRHARWIGTNHDGYADEYPVYDEYQCSQCGAECETEDEPLGWNFCPMCGAKMDGGDQDEAD